MKKSLVTNIDRIWEIDFLRGICIILMFLDHIMFFSIKFETILWTDNLNNFQLSLFKISNYFYNGELKFIRLNLRKVVLITFFVIVGISSEFSKNNFKRFINLALIAVGLSIVTYYLTKFTEIKIFINWGIIHCYASCILIYLIFKKIKLTNYFTITLVAFFAMFLVIYFKPTINNSNILMPIGIPSKNYLYHYEYFPILEWLGFFLLGIIIGKTLYKKKTSKLKFMNRLRIKPISLIGRFGKIIYPLHFIIIFCILFFSKFLN